MKGIKIFLKKIKKKQQYGREQYENLPEYGREQYENLPEDEIQRLLDFRKIIKYGKIKPLRKKDLTCFRLALLT